MPQPPITTEPAADRRASEFRVAEQCSIAARSTRRRLAGFAAVLALTAAACSDDGSDNEADVPDTDAPASSDDRTSETPEPVIVTSATGNDIEVTPTAERVYALEEITALGLATLDVRPIATQEFFGYGYSFLDDIADEVAPLNESVELIAAADPSLIVAINHPFFTEFEDELAAIAPVVFTDFAAPWDEQLGVLAGVTGRTDQAAAVTTLIDNETAALAADLQADWAGAEASLLAAGSNGPIAYGPTTLPGTILDQLGFTRSELQSGGAESFGFIELSEELLADETDTSDILIDIQIDGGAPDGERLADNPLLAASGFRAIIEPDAVWEANHALAAWTILHDLRATLLDGAAITDDPATRWAELLPQIQQ